MIIRNVRTIVGTASRRQWSFKEFTVYEDRAIVRSALTAPYSSLSTIQGMTETSIDY